jgi:reactive intermediate/imine deaminase
MRVRFPVCLIIGALAACGGRNRPETVPDRERAVPHPVRSADAAFLTRRAGRQHAYLSGQIGTPDATSGTLVPGGIEAETRQTLENIKDVLQRTGSSMDRVVKCTVMMADMREWDRMNVVYATYFPKNKPARSALGANGLALGARVEIECWATVG